MARSPYTDLQRKRLRRYRDRARRFRASAAKTKKRADRPAFIQLAQLCDILADGIKAQPSRRCAAHFKLKHTVQMPSLPQPQPQALAGVVSVCLFGATWISCRSLSLSESWRGLVPALVIVSSNKGGGCRVYRPNGRRQKNHGLESPYGGASKTFAAHQKLWGS